MSQRGKKWNFVVYYFPLYFGSTFTFETSVRKLNLPPSPILKLAVIGHLYILKHPLYRTLANLSTQYGPVFSLQLGTRFVVMVSSPSAAEECFIRQHEVKLLVQRVFHKSGDYFELKSKLFQMSYNIIMRMVAGKTYYCEKVDNHEANHFRELVEQVISHGDADFIMPVIFLLFFRSTDNKLDRLGNNMDALLQGLIDEHCRDKSRNTMIAHLQES